MGKRISQRDGYAERSTLPGEWSLDVHRDNIESLPFRTATPAKELCGAILIEANLRNACLIGTDLTQNNLDTPCDLTGADLTGATWNASTRLPADFSPEAHG